VLSTQITAPPALVAAIAAKTDVSCHNGQNGAVTVGVTGGTQPYAYHWSTGGTTSGLTGLAAATYVLTVTDANQCTTLLTVVIANPALLAVSVLTKTDVVCPNGATGSITAGAGGGTPPYAYQWSNAGTGPTIGGLTVGTYTLTLTDANGCSKSLTAQIVATDQNPPQLLLQNASVDLDQGGQAVIFPGLFDNGSVDAECGIAAWTVSPTSFGCGQVGNRVVTLTATDLSGNTSTGTAVLTVEDNIMPTLVCPFDIVAASCQPVVQFTLPQVEDNCPVNPNSLVQIAGLPSGSTFPVGLTQQIFRYTDPSENAAQCSFLVEVAAPVTITAAPAPASCAGSCDGGIVLSLGGTAGQATVSWDNGQSGATLSGLCPGIYVATVNDGFSCVYTQSVEVLAQDQVAPVVVCPPNVVQPYCLGAVQYAAPTVQDNCAVDPAGLAMIQGLPSGSTFPVGNTVQIFQYTDSGGNVGECSFAVTVIGGPLATFAATAATCAGLCDGSAALTLTGGNGPFTHQWSNGQTGATISGLCAGTYTVTITDAGGCSQTGLATVTQPAPLQIVVDQVTGYGGGSSPGSISISVSGGTGGYSYSWTRNGQFFSGTQDLTSLQPGQYQVVLTDAAGCTLLGDVITVINLVTAASEATWASGLTLFPNPASQAFYLRLDAPLDQTLRVTLLHPSGQAVQTQWLSRIDPVIRIDISGLPAGLWLVQISDEDGRKVVRKVVVN
jgi:hypothetical protein